MYVKVWMGDPSDVNVSTMADMGIGLMASSPFSFPSKGKERLGWNVIHSRKKEKADRLQASV